MDSDIADSNIFDEALFNALPPRAHRCTLAHMRRPSKSGHILWRKRLLGTLAVVLLAVQLASVVHAIDLGAHDGGNRCEYCQAYQRIGTALTADPAVPLFKAVYEPPVTSSTALIIALYRSRPPVRAPPR